MFHVVTRIPGILLTLPCVLTARPFIQAVKLEGCQTRVESAQAAAESSPDNPGLQLQLARTLSGCGQFSRAITQYREYLQKEPGQAAIWYELGQTLARARQPLEAEKAFGKMLKIAPENIGGELGLAQALAATGSYPEALEFYDKVLAADSRNYDALEGKASVLYWTHRFKEAEAIFRQLVRTNPKDEENHKMLDAVRRAEDAARWKKLRPAPGSPPAATVSYSISYLADHPDDRAALEELTMAEARLKNYPAALGGAERALRLDPEDRTAQDQLAQILSWDRQYDASIRIYQRMLREAPEDVRTLENLARVYAWAGRWHEALRTEQRLLAIEPQNVRTRLAVARLEIRLKDDSEARKNLALILRQHPQEREARLELARLELRNGHLELALKDYSFLFGSNFEDPDALYGAARIYYYLGNPARALPLAETLVRERPKDFDALMLLARVQHALGHQKSALKFVRMASRLSPGNPEAAELRAQIHHGSAVTLHTSASYAREVTFRDPFVTNRGFQMPGRPLEDLNSYSAVMKVGFAFLPRSSSYVSIASMPSNSPMGGIQGAVAPAEVLYGQTTQISKPLILRGGLGLVRMGPGEFAGVAGQMQPLETLGITPIGFLGYSFLPNQKLRFDLTASRAAITYTPTSVRFGARRTRIEAGLRYAFNSRTTLDAILYHEKDFSALYDQMRSDLGGTTLLERNGRDNGNGGSLVFTRNLIRGERFSLDAGYSGLAFGYAGERRGVFMGFFNPLFYQQHLATSHFYGRFWGPVGYGLIADFGVQQADEAAPFTRAIKIGPRLSFRLSPRISLNLGYLHYDFAQSLGSIKGNVVQLSTDWRF